MFTIGNILALSQTIVNFFNSNLTVVFFILPRIYAATVLLINWYPYERTMTAKVAYVLAWSVFSTAVEYTFYLVEYEHFHIGWKWWYSAISYPFLYGILLFERRLMAKGCN